MLTLHLPQNKGFFEHLTILKNKAQEKDESSNVDCAALQLQDFSVEALKYAKHYVMVLQAFVIYP